MLRDDSRLFDPTSSLPHYLCLLTTSLPHYLTISLPLLAHYLTTSLPLLAHQLTTSLPHYLCLLIVALTLVPLAMISSSNNLTTVVQAPCGHLVISLHGAMDSDSRVPVRRRIEVHLHSLLWGEPQEAFNTRMHSAVLYYECTAVSGWICGHKQGAHAVYQGPLPHIRRVC